MEASHPPREKMSWLDAAEVLCSSSTTLFMDQQQGSSLEKKCGII